MKTFKNFYKKFVPSQKIFGKETFNKEINDFYRHIKLKANFKDTISIRISLKTKY